MTVDSKAIEGCIVPVCEGGTHEVVITLGK